MRSPSSSGALLIQGAVRSTVPAGGTQCQKSAFHVTTPFLCLPSFSTGLGHWVRSLLPLSPWFLFCCFPPSRLPFSCWALAWLLRGLSSSGPPVDPVFTPPGLSPLAVPDATLGSGFPFETSAPALLRTGVPHPSGLGQPNLPGFPSPRELARGHSWGEGGREGGIRAAVVERCQGQERGPAAVAGQEEKEIRQA